MKITLEKLAELTDSSFMGDGDTIISTAASLSEANEQQISFINNPKYIKQLKNTEACCVIMRKKIAETYSGNSLINEDPYLTFARVVEILYSVEKSHCGIHSSVVISSESNIHKTAHIGANVVIEKGVDIDENCIIDAGCFIGNNVKLEKGVHIYPNVTIYSDTKIDTNSVIHAGSVIGADGFGFAPKPDKSWFKIQQVGNVVIGAHVEIGANTTVDRAALGSTVIENGVILDNQIQIGHNVSIGENTAVAAGALIAGSTKIGKRCQIGGSTAISGHLEITDDVVITGNSMVIQNIKQAGVYSSGVTAETNDKWRRNTSRFKQLDEMARRIKELEKKLNEK